VTRRLPHGLPPEPQMPPSGASHSAAAAAAFGAAQTGAAHPLRPPQPAPARKHNSRHKPDTIIKHTQRLSNVWQHCQILADLGAIQLKGWHAPPPPGNSHQRAHHIDSRWAVCPASPLPLMPQAPVTVNLLAGRGATRMQHYRSTSRSVPA
jgi:hypothetical protein